MHAVTSSLARGEYGVSRRGTDETGGADDFFRKIFGDTLLGSESGMGGLQQMLDRIGQRFPNVNVVSSEAKNAGTAAAKAQPAEEGADEVEVSESLLKSMFGDDALAKMVEDTIAAFLDRGSDGNLMHFEGAMVTRSISITITTVRYSERHSSSETGDLLASGELRTNFHERLAEMMKEFFGGKKADETAAGTEDKRAERADFSGVMWSMEIYYSATFVSSLNQSETANGAASGYQAQSLGMYGSFTQGLFSSLLPQGLSGRSEGSDAGGFLPDFLRDVLAGLNLETDGFQIMESGFAIGIRERRNLLAELMEMYRDKIGQIGAVEEEPAVEAPTPEAETPEDIQEPVAAASA